MNLRVIFGSIFCLFVIGFNPIRALTQADSISKFESLILDSEKAFKSGDWTQSIALGESALELCHLRLSINNLRCMYIMKNNSLVYEKADELVEHADEIERAYRVALLQFGPSHHFTVKTREAFYQLAVKQNRYSETIPILIALIHHERTNANDKQEILNKFTYVSNRAFLHTDENLMPSRKKAWSSWNSITKDKKTCVTYWLNKLQNLKTDKNYLGPINKPLKIIPGMESEVDILTGKKTILSFLLKPVLRAKYSSLRER